MDDLAAELKELMDFKETIEVGDVVLIVSEDPKMLAFAVVTDITRDSSRRAEWWHVGMQMLSVPLQPMTWTLRMPQMCGREIFTMGGKKMYMAPVRIPYGAPRPKPVQYQDVTKKHPKGTARLRVVK